MVVDGVSVSVTTLNRTLSVGGHRILYVLFVCPHSLFPCSTPPQKLYATTTTARDNRMGMNRHVRNAFEHARRQWR